MNGNLWPDVALDADGQLIEGLSEPLTKEDWQAYLTYQRPGRPEPISRLAYERLSPAEQASFNRDRAAYHSSLDLVTTPGVTTTRHRLSRIMTVNQHAQPSARTGVMLSGPSRVGKTTAIKVVAGEYELSLRENHPHLFSRSGDEFLPVVFIEAPNVKRDVAKAMLETLLQYYGHPLKSSSPIVLQESVVNLIRRCGTQLIIIDDIHFIDLTEKSGRDANNLLKALANSVAATFVVTGVDLERTQLFSEGTGGSSRSTQTSGRYTLVTFDRYCVDTHKDIFQWAAQVKAFEDRLVLLDHPQGTLAKGLWRYLHERTGGRVGPLYLLIRLAAHEAQTSGQERITRKILDSIVLDIGSEAEFLELCTRTGRSSKN